MTLYAEAQDQLRQVRMTLEAVEHAVAIVYGHFSNGRLTKCNTDPQQVIAVIEDVINAEYEKENLAQWILEAEQGRAEIKRLCTALTEVLEVVNAAIYQSPALCQVRESVTDALQGKGDRVTL